MGDVTGVTWLHQLLRYSHATRTPQAAPIEATQQPFKKEYGGPKSYHPIMMEELLMTAVVLCFL